MKVKDSPEDFEVEEVLKLNLKERGDYAYFILEKKSWTTLKALGKIADSLRINVQRLTVAGQKDKQGVTKQYVSVYQVSDRALSRVKIKDIKIKFLGYGDKAISLGDLEGNKFRLVVRELEEPLGQIDFVVNYYDEQRFGGYRPNFHLVGKETLLGNYEEAVRLLLLHPFPEETEDYKEAREEMEEEWGEWNPRKLPMSMSIERKIVGYLEKNPQDFKGALRTLPRQLFAMLTHAYQAYIFNKSLAEYLKQFKHREVDYVLGKLVFVDNYIDLDWPIVGYNTQLEGEQKKIIENIMKRENIKYETFRCQISALSSEGITRKAMIKVENYKLGEFKNNTQRVSFFLPKGSYATIVMKSLDK